jgi:hypothetical protein
VTFSLPHVSASGSQSAQGPHVGERAAAARRSPAFAFTFVAKRDNATCGRSAAPVPHVRPRATSYVALVNSFQGHPPAPPLKYR